MYIYIDVFNSTREVTNFVCIRYFMNLTVHKDTRESSTSVELEVIGGSAPEIILDTSFVIVDSASKVSFLNILANV